MAETLIAKPCPRCGACPEIALAGLGAGRWNTVIGCWHGVPNGYDGICSVGWGDDAASSKAEAVSLWNAKVADQ